MSRRGTIPAWLALLATALNCSAEEPVAASNGPDGAAADVRESDHRSADAADASLDSERVGDTRHDEPASAANCSDLELPCPSECDTIGGWPIVDACIALVDGRRDLACREPIGANGLSSCVMDAVTEEMFVLASDTYRQELVARSGWTSCPLGWSSFPACMAYVHASVDNGCDGTIDGCIVSGVDEYGDEVSRFVDEGCDGSGDTCRYAHYAPPGAVQGTDEDDACDGSIEACEGFLRDGDGQLLGGIVDEGCDGIAEDCVTYALDANGDAVFADYDASCDGVVDRCWQATYNEDGNRLTLRDDEGCDGTHETCSTWRYDVNGALLGVEVDEGCDGTPDRCTSYD